MTAVLFFGGGTGLGGSCAFWASTSQARIHGGDERFAAAWFFDDGRDALNEIAHASDALRLRYDLNASTNAAQQGNRRRCRIGACDNQVRIMCQHVFSGPLGRRDAARALWVCS